MLKGSTRYVFFIWHYAFKIPSLYSWKNFLLGILANLQEIKFSKCKDYKDKLCPIYFYIVGGLLIVMPKVRTLSENEIDSEILSNFIDDGIIHLPVENKDSSFGYLNGKLVAIDYGS